MSAHGHHGHGSGDGGTHPAHIPYWKRAHTDWRFWTGIVLMFAAMVIYLMSFDLAVRPGAGQTKAAMPDAVGR